ncbi:hypothetical protein [Aliiroseovarius sp. YM-037]|uniref:hypothetical protein n=1 Tax=Aliiroseovarius sp. YM-037 TaxID=3341728 RepID=UPI003A800B62
MTRLLIIAALAGTVSTASVAVAETGGRWDRIEDRIDRRENRIDERVTHGRRDRIEDVVDRWEDRRDRAGLPTPGRINRHERRSWIRRWGG